MRPFSSVLTAVATLALLPAVSLAQGAATKTSTQSSSASSASSSRDILPKLSIRPENVKITPVEEVFSR